MTLTMHKGGDKHMRDAVHGELSEVARNVAFFKTQSPTF